MRVEEIAAHGGGGVRVRGGCGAGGRTGHEVGGEGWNGEVSSEGGGMEGLEALQWWKSYGENKSRG